MDKWNAANKNIQVEYVRFVNEGSGNTKRDAALLSNTDAPAIGAKVPGADWTWDDYASLAKKQRSPDNTAPFAAGLGASNFNHPDFKKGLEIQKDCIFYMNLFY